MQVMTTSEIDRQDKDGSSAQAADNAAPAKTSITISMDKRIAEALRKKAERNGRSVEEEILLEVRRDLVFVDDNPPDQQDSSKSLAEEIHELFADIGGMELELPPRLREEPPKPE